MNAVLATQRGTKLASLAAAVAIACIAAGAGFWYGTRHAPMPPTKGTTTAATPMQAQPAAAAERKVLYWHDPMVPNAKFDKPGKSPFMDMDLVPVYATSGAGEGGVAISPRQVQSFGVRMAEAKEGLLETGFSAVGVVGIDERALLAVQARSQGYVERLHVRAQYDNVVAGQLLADLYVPEWLAAQEELLALKASTQPGAAQLADAARGRLRAPSRETLSAAPS